MINVVQNNEIYEITFPYDINIVYLVKSIPFIKRIAIKNKNQNIRQVIMKSISCLLQAQKLVIGTNANK